MDILKKTLEQMSPSFTSNEFSRKAKRNGLTKREVANGVIALFLHRSAIQGETRRTWKKINCSTTNQYKSDKIQSDAIMDAIDLLKSNGYKILKPVSDWIEL